MTMLLVAGSVVTAIAVAAILVHVRRAFTSRFMHLWFGPYLAGLPKYVRRRRGPVHLLLCVADHYEPRFGGVPPEQARRRVANWVDRYPRLFEGFRDSDGRPPRHTFFYPAEEYEPEYLDALAELCRSGFGEVEVHLHHDNDTAENLRKTLLDFKTILADRHGLLAHDPETGEPVYAFIHGNWALDNSRHDGRWCGVNNEIDVLIQTGCYVDMTMPSAPSSTQTRTINQIYFAVDDPNRPKSHDMGVAIGTAPAPAGSLLLIQGPLLMDWGLRRRGRPRVENGCIQGSQPAQIDRVDAWLAAGVQVPGRPDWSFVKLYTHGAPEANQATLLGPAMVEFHKALAQRAATDPNFHYHYVTAREMYNLALAAEAGWRGSVEDARNYRLNWEATPTLGSVVPARGEGR